MFHTSSNHGYYFPSTLCSMLIQFAYVLFQQCTNSMPKKLPGHHLHSIWSLFATFLSCWCKRKYWNNKIGKIIVTLLLQYPLEFQNVTIYTALLVEPWEILYFDSNGRSSFHIHVIEFYIVHFKQLSEIWLVISESQTYVSAQSIDQLYLLKYVWQKMNCTFVCTASMWCNCILLAKHLPTA